MTALFPQLTALPLNAGGQAPQREDFNGLYKLIGQWVRFYMYGGVPSWTSSAAAGAHTHSVAIAAAGAHTHALTISKTGSGAAFSILPPYIAVYMWRRTA